MEDFIPTRGSKVNKDAVKEFVSFNYEKSKKKEKENVKNQENNELKISKFSTKKNEQNENNDQKRKQELEMKRIRYEVMKFGMSGFQKTKAKKAKVALAISLGAKPPKNKGVNYKELKDRRKKQKNAQKRMEHVSGLEKSLIKHKTKKTRKKNSGDILGIYGTVNEKLLGKNKN